MKNNSESDKRKLEEISGYSWDELNQLTELDLSRKGIKKLPECLSGLKNLQELDLRENQLASVPETIGNLESLQELNIGVNNLSTLPESIGNLKSLEKLYLYLNHLTHLPESIGELKSLEFLDLLDNKLTCLPESTVFLKKLTHLYIDLDLLQKLPLALKHYTKAKIYISLDEIEVRLPEQCVNHVFSEWKEEWLLEFKNTEHRMMLVKVLGYEMIMKKLGSITLHKEIDRSGNEMELHKIEIASKVQSADEPEEDIVLLKVVCPSTGKIHILRVPPGMTDCEEARRWTLFDEKIEMRFVDET